METSSSSLQNVATKRTSRPPPTNLDKEKETDKKLVREYNRLYSSDNFMDSFKETSRRGNRKPEIDSKNSGRKSPTALYDKNGYLAGEDFCDCGDNLCKGCFFPCTKCLSFKCGHECRRNRKWQYESCIVEGEDILYRK
ncbi:hypothetical protein WDU94_008761 [Cyamophila willieti]